ncbi:MAG: type II secretion system protein GspL [bacterium]
MWARRILGLDLGTSSAKVVQLTISPKGKPFVARAALVEDRAELASLLSDKQWRRPSDPIHAALPSDRVIHRPLSLPFKDSSKIIQALPYELEGEVPFAAEDMVAAFFPQGPFRQESGQPLLAMAVPRQSIQSRLQELGELGVDPCVLEPDAAALARLVLCSGLEASGGFVVMETGASKTNLLFFQEGSLKTLRSIPRGMAGQEGGLQQELILELERTFLAFQSRGKAQGLQALYLCGGIVQDPKAMEQIRERWRLPVVVLDTLPGWTSQTSMEQAVSPSRFATALGLALYGLNKATMGSNLRLGEFHYRPGMAAMKGRILVAAALVSAALGLGIADIETKVSLRQKQLYALQQETRGLFRQAFPEVTQVVDPVLQMQRLLEERKAKHLNFLSQDPRTTVLELLREISVREQARTLRITELDISGENVNIRGEATAYDVIEKAKDHWSASPLLDAVEVKNAKKNPKSQLWDFQCSARRKVS